MSAEPKTEEWSPDFAPHVKGRYTPRIWDVDRYDPQIVTAECTICKETLYVECSSGRVREKISKWAILHLHR